MALQEITLQDCLLRRGDLITDTQLNSIFNEILKGPTERIMMLLILIRVVTGKWHFHKGNGHGHPWSGTGCSSGFLRKDRHIQ